VLGHGLSQFVLGLMLVNGELMNNPSAGLVFEND